VIEFIGLIAYRNQHLFILDKTKSRVKLSVYENEIASRTLQGSTEAIASAEPGGTTCEGWGLSSEKQMGELWQRVNY